MNYGLTADDMDPRTTETLSEERDKVPMNGDMPPSESLLDLVRTRLTDRLQEQSGEELREVRILQTLARPYSSTRILQIVTDQGTRRIVLKQVVEHPLNASVIEDPDQAAVEFSVLTRIHPGFAGVDRCSVPLPILLLPEINAYLMEYVDGRVLSDQLNFVHYLADRSRFVQLQQHFYDCGRWLRHFHTITGRRLSDFTAVDNVLVRCHDRLRVIEEARDPGCPSNFRRLATDCIEKQVDRLANSKILVTGRHGDFGPWNILAHRGSGVTVIDFFGYREDPLPIDVFTMLVFFESQEHNLANSASRVRKLRERFLAGLGPLPALPDPLILLCEAQQRILHIAGRVLESRDGFFRRWERNRSLRTNVAWFLSASDKSTLWPRCK